MRPGIGWRAVGRQPVERRQHEGRGLAGAGLGDAEQVAAGKDGRDGLRLDRRRHDIILRRERVEEGLREPEVGEFGQNENPICKATAAPNGADPPGLEKHPA